MNSLKVVIIGAGSSYTPEIIEGLINRYQEFPITEICLVDIDSGKEKAQIIKQLAIRMVEKSTLPIKVDLSFNRQSALIHADFVCNQIRVGGLEAREKDERIPLSYGLLGQETNGAGGLFKALRTIPVVLEIANDMARLCPDAWLINFTNPAGIVTEAITKHTTHQKVIGVCNIPYNMRTSISKTFSTHVDDVEIEFIGLNHFSFGRRVTIKGVDRTKEVMQSILDDSAYKPANIIADDWSKTFLTSFKLLPNPYHSYYFKPAAMLQKSIESYKQKGTRAEIVRKVEKELFAKYANKDLAEKPKELEQRGGAYYSDAACSVMTSIYNNKKDIQTINTVNKGTITGLAYDAVIETNALIGSSGAQPIVIGEMPKAIKGHIQLLKAFEELVIEAAITGDRSLVYQALIMNPLVRDESQVEVVMEELISAHSAYLPLFSPKQPSF